MLTIPVATSYGVGQYRAAEAHCLTTRRGEKFDASSVGVLWGHGMLHTPAVDGTGTHRFIGDAFAREGFMSLITDLGGGATFGNDDSIDAADDGVSYLVARGSAPSPLALAASSMGAMPILYWASQNLSDVIAIAMSIPAVDAQDVYANDRGGLASDIDAAWGGNWAAAEATRNPINFADDLAAIPIGIWYSSNDDIILPARVEAFASAHGNSELHPMGAVGHALNAETTAAMAAWLRETVDAA